MDLVHLLLWPMLDRISWASSLYDLKWWTDCDSKYLQISVSLFQFGSAELAQLYAGLIRSIAELVNCDQRGVVRCWIFWVISQLFLRFSCFLFRLGFWDGLPSSAPITQAEFGSSILAIFSYVVPDISRVACQMSQLYYLGTFDPLRFVAWAAGCLLPMYCQSTFLPV